MGYWTSNIQEACPCHMCNCKGCHECDGENPPPTEPPSDEGPDW